MSDFLKRRAEMIKKAKLSMGENYAKELDQRRTGKTTAMALGYISYAMLHPEEHVELLDHEDGTWDQNKNLTKIVEEIVLNLKLEGLYINGTGRKRNYSLVYSLDPKGEVIFTSKLGKKLYR